MEGASAEMLALVGQVVPVLQAGLSPDQATREQAEHHFKQSGSTVLEFGEALSRILLSSEVDLGARQLCGVVLRQYVETHWSYGGEGDDKFVAPEVPAEIKAVIRAMLPPGLADTASGVRTTTAHIISTIASEDWPEAWPELFPTLQAAINSGSAEATHGAMRVLIEFAGMVTPEQIPHVAPQLLPQLLAIFGAEAERDIRSRSRAVQIFTKFVEKVGEVDQSEEAGAALGQLLEPAIPQWLEGFVAVLGRTDDAVADVGIKSDIMRSIAVLLESFPAPMAAYLPQLLPPIWALLVGQLEPYTAAHINAEVLAEEVVDEDGEVIGMESLISRMLRIISMLASADGGNAGGKKERKQLRTMYRTFIKTSMTDLVYYALSYAQMTEDQAERWMADPEQYVKDEIEEDTSANNLRVVIKDLIGIDILEEFKSKGCIAVLTAVQRLVQAGTTAREAGSPHWWKPCEAAMVAVQISSAEIVGLFRKGTKAPFTLPDLTACITSFIAAEGCPFLQGRALAASAEFTDVLPLEPCAEILQACGAALQGEQPAPIQVSAVQAVQKLCAKLGEERKPMIMPLVGPLLETLLGIATRSDAELLSHIFDTINVLVPLNPEATLLHQAQLGTLINAVFLKYSADPFVSDSLCDMVETIAQIPQLMPCLEDRLLTTALSVIGQHANPELVGLVDQAVDLVGTVLKQLTPPVNPALIQAAFPAIVGMMLQTDDLQAMQNGCDCLRAFVRAAPAELAQWSDGALSGYDYIVQVIQRILHPDMDPSASVFIGTFITQFLLKGVGVTPEMCVAIFTAVLAKLLHLNSARLHNIQGLVFVLAYWINMDPAAALNFLAERGALQTFFDLWCDNHESFWGRYTMNVSALAMMKVFQTRDPRLAAITVKGEELPAVGRGIRTRSKTKAAPPRFTQIPLYCKMVKLVIKEFGQRLNEEQDQLEHARHVGQALNEDGESDGDGEWEDDDGDDDVEAFAHKSPFAPAENYDLSTSEVINLDGMFEGDEDDEEGQDDPLYHVDMKAASAEFLKLLAADAEAAAMILPTLTPNEQRTANAAVESA